MSYEHSSSYAPDVMRYTNAYFMRLKERFGDRVFDEVYEYVDKEVFWIPDNDEIVTYEELNLAYPF